MPGPLGPLPCWAVEGSGPMRDAWLVAVHGRGASRAQTWRLLAGVCELGLSALAVSYRNDERAPATGRYQLGHGEWEDIEAAITYARGRGARTVILAGYSMGGAIVSAFLRRSQAAPLVGGVILDAPVLDWRAVLRWVVRQKWARRANLYGVGEEEFTLAVAPRTRSREAGARV